MRVDDVDLVACRPAQAKHQTVGGDIHRDKTVAGCQRELRESRRSFMPASESRHQSHHQHADRDDDQNAQKNDGRQRAAIGYRGSLGRSRRRGAGFGQI